MPKCDFNKVAKQLRHGCSPVNLLHIFKTLFSKNTAQWLLLNNECPERYVNVLYTLSLSELSIAVKTIFIEVFSLTLWSFL